ncbi:putative helicase mov-10-B.1 [Anopheles marshallii]|uniref:putative helicase mov-10-B.1 n=1 Tax=Anopheles marshallii TaxID=1521116 RepID=UPI00237C1EBB|nr:putative helicase mov-10-B.1 [Anopheles marshallii]
MQIELPVQQVERHITQVERNGTSRPANYLSKVRTFGERPGTAGKKKLNKQNIFRKLRRTRCLLQWVESSLNVGRNDKPLSVPKQVFRLKVEFDVVDSTLALNIQNMCSQVLILRSIFLYYETYKRVSLFDGVIRMVSGYEFTMEKNIHEKEDRSYHLVLLCHVLGTNYKLRETVMIHKLMPRKPRGLPLRLSKLPLFEVPDYVQDVYLNGFLTAQHYNRNAKLWLERFRKYREEQLNSSNYIEYLRMLNQIDEFDSHLQMLRYTIETATLEEMTAPKEYLLTIEQFKVPPVLLDISSHVHVFYAPNLPCVTRGCIIDCSSHFIIRTEIPLRKLSSLKLTFPLNRTRYKMEYMALNYLCSLDLNSVVFPSPEASKPNNTKDGFKEEPITTFEWHQDCIAQNERQKQAIQNIINRTAYPAPYILFGPPGTGKTYTIVEAVLQIYKLRPKSRILVTATSNYACNELTKRLLKYVNHSDIFRYFSVIAERDIHGIDLKVLEVSNMHCGNYETPAMEDFTQTRILVCTVINCGRLLQLEVARNMYDYIFIDECGSCNELSALVPIGCVGTDSVNKRLHASIVLAGDPKQLGPVTRMSYLKNTPHDVSLLQRLMELPLYSKDMNNNEYNPDMVTKLLDNYRSHRALFRYSNEQFYESELRAKGAPAITSWAVNWQRLPNPNFPMIFHSVIGHMKQDSITLSYWNVQEANKVYEYVQLLMKDQINGRIMQQEDIGIVTPYSKQVEFLKNGLSLLGFDNIEVGSAEQYQGREKPVIIISTVRSNRTTVGFLADPRRLNVVLTRAQALTIIIGNPINLVTNSSWYSFLQLLEANGALMDKKFKLQKKKPSECDLRKMEQSYRQTSFA